MVRLQIFEEKSTQPNFLSGNFPSHPPSTTSHVQLQSPSHINPPSYLAALPPWPGNDTCGRAPLPPPTQTRAHHSSLASPTRWTLSSSRSTPPPNVLAYKERGYSRQPGQQNRVWCVNLEHPIEFPSTLRLNKAEQSTCLFIVPPQTDTLTVFFLGTILIEANGDHHQESQEALQQLNQQVGRNNRSRALWYDVAMLLRPRILIFNISLNVSCKKPKKSCLLGTATGKQPRQIMRLD